MSSIETSIATQEHVLVIFCSKNGSQCAISSVSTHNLLLAHQTGIMTQTVSLFSSLPEPEHQASTPHLPAKRFFCSDNELSKIDNGKSTLKLVPHHVCAIGNPSKTGCKIQALLERNGAYWQALATEEGVMGTPHFHR